MTPSLIRVAGGALLVWARGQGAGYGLRTARFAKTWSAPRRLGTGGAWSPRFADLAGTGRFLVHRSSAGWTALELDSDGRQLRRAEIQTESRERPVLTAAGGGLALRWQDSGSPRPLRWEGPR